MIALTLSLIVACGGDKPADDAKTPPEGKADTKAEGKAGKADTKAEAKAEVKKRPVTSVSSGAADAAAPCVDCNVVWITMDTTRADRMGFYGNKDGLTPNLDKLAKEGTAFRHAWSQAPETTLSVGSYFSGRYRHNNGMDFYLAEKEAVHPLSDELTTIAEVLGGRGYRTAGMYANPLMWEKSNLYLEQGFDVWRAAPDELIAETGLKLWQNGIKQEGKVFLYAHWFGPHTDNEKTEGFEKRRGTFKSTLGTINEKVFVGVRTGKLTPTGDDVAYIRAMYDDAVWQMDQQIGAFVASIRGTPEGARTIWVVTADHGESMLEPADPPWLGHEAHFHEEMLRVPILVVSPGVEAGKVNTTRVAEVIDLAPTLMGLLGVPVDAAWKWDGEALVGPTAKEGGPALSDRGVWAKRQVSARDAKTSLIVQVNEKKSTCYDLAKDPYQTVKIDGDARCAPLQAAVDAYVAGAHPPARSAEAPTGTAEETEDMLKKLGYTE